MFYCGNRYKDVIVAPNYGSIIIIHSSLQSLLLLIYGAVRCYEIKTFVISYFESQVIGSQIKAVAIIAVYGEKRKEEIFHQMQLQNRRSTHAKSI